MLIKLYPDNLSPRHLTTIYECLMDGGVIIYPTDTVYSFGGNSASMKALDKIAKLKGIKKEKANFSLIFNDLTLLSHYSKPFDKAIFKLLKKHLPGPFTFILEANSQVPKLFQNKKKSIGIRIPEHPIPAEIVRLLGNPMFSASIHADDRIIEFETDPEILHDEWGDMVDIVIDAGFGGNIASTVVDCSSDEIEIIRQGKGELDY
ncbi:MAG: L-threonylcarbamoyladenylate synthase [Bacteroidales bacterium]|nr:L-threonylcarbamoyladenylate synthase [Bacteroidales bacterium]